ncbi:MULTISPECIES: gamma-glutamyltransferase [Priestia]|uniref:gamma-glutamyltransferase n=1 Tax=Priestia TaxID=2800373 RepID=UPI001786AD7F|nr:gamma-glutamyltransferase [Priestia megaterium]MBD8845714.1 gamma-glutamyltransferase [Priestia megaterium]MCF6794963.1 gamma-glutamyltransferase [Bacillus sp. ET1]MDN4861115.1 gamma-glutamyltransferase [Priestia megaterium]WDM33105.1 gamma-glutamyltransferase [Priestia megaterium]
MKRKWMYSLIFLAVLLVGGYAIVQQFNSETDNKFYKKINKFESSREINHSSGGYGVSSSNPIAVEVGMDVLEEGGNAVDAAVAVSYALGVVEPYGSGIGGGGGMLILPGDQSDKPTFFDYRETSPTSSEDSEEGIGVPGFVKGMETVHEKYGSKKMDELIEPAIKLADDGFPVGQQLAERLKGAQYRLSEDEIPNFFPGNQPIEEGEKLEQPELGETLELIKEKGSDVFYNGELAEEIADEVPGIQKSDLEEYSVEEREPVQGEFAGYDVISAPPPFSGITLIQSLQMAEMLNVQKAEEDTALFTHLTSEITNRANSDRVKHIGDPAFSEIDEKELTDKEYSRELAQDISLNELSEKYQLKGKDLEEEHISTTHFVVTDKDGTVVSVTNTLSNFFGSGENVEGFFLNNNLNNFNNIKNSLNYYEPGKRSRTFTAPTILRKDNEVIGIGTPGGSRIPMMLTEVLVRHLLFKESLQDAIDAPRFSIENNHLYTEFQYPTSIREELEGMGYDVEEKSSSIYYGGVQAIVIDQKDNVIYGGADPRRQGTWKVK